jgi:fructose-bisphosphate aldolase, class II
VEDAHRTPEVYAEMLDRAKAGAFAYPAINVTSSQTSTPPSGLRRGRAATASSRSRPAARSTCPARRVKDMVAGAVALAEFAHVVAEQYDVNIALHTDHCPKDKLDGFMRPLLAHLAPSGSRTRRGKPLFQSHMWDGSAVPLEENLEIAEELLAACRKANIIMEIEIGVVGGEEDGVVHEINDKLYTTPRTPRTVEALGTRRARPLHARRDVRQRARRLQAGQRQAAPSILKEIQDAVGAQVGGDKPFDLVFHGGSGSLLEEIREALDYGVVKMNIDTDTQYAFTRPIADHMFRTTTAC